MFQEPHVENPRGLFGLMLIIAFSFFLPMLFKRNNRKSCNRCSNAMVSLTSTLFNIQSMAYGIAAIIGFIILLVISIKH